MAREMIIVLDFGGQYNQLIARRVRECNVYCEVHPYNMSLDQIREMQHTLETVEYKCWFYETAQAAGTTDVPIRMAEEEVPQRFRAIRRELHGEEPVKDDASA